MKTLKLDNFRCFETFEMEFRTGLNLLIGDNSSGKTTVLKALKIALSSFFMGFSDEYTRFIGIDKSDFTVSSHGDMMRLDRPVKISFRLMDSVFPGSDVLWLELHSKKSKTTQKGVKDYKAYAQQKFQLIVQGENQAPLPLFACFSTEDIHSSRKISEAKFKQYALPPSFGYYECLQGDGFFDYWIKRLLVLTEGKRSLNEVEIVRQAIIGALGEDGCNIIRDVSVRPQQGVVYFVLIDGREVAAETLSDGYKRLVNIVMDLAFRCAILNGRIYGTEAYKETCGTVLIDEIDEHLHPSLQTVVMACLHKAFPKLQFIITTHAPMVMSSIETNEDNVVYKLNYDVQSGYTQTAVSTYGMDASQIIEVFMHHAPRVKAVADELEALFGAIDAEEVEKAQNMLAEMKQKYGQTIPELSQAAAMLTFYES
ncbi:MAG: AAA family ATPase [Bacteroidaceae bacterium]|nr:AAA family ATPase [Bacteroidaceae bacterium]